MINRADREATRTHRIETAASLTAKLSAWNACCTEDIAADEVIDAPPETVSGILEILQLPEVPHGLTLLVVAHVP
jgi:hypothetical protein